MLAPLRWDILKVMLGAGPLSLRQIARRAAHDVRGVYTNVRSLLGAGLIERDQAGFGKRYPATMMGFVNR